MLLTEKNNNQSLETNNREVVIRARNLGVSFQAGNKDDYKSHIINFLKNNKNQEEGKLFWPLRNLNFEGYKGEILGIIGSNGSGKTTLCKMLSGILKPDEGDLFIDGRVSALFSLGMGFNKELTGRENVYLNGMMLGLSKERINHSIDEIHEFSGLGDFFDRPMKTYSSGMKAKLGFSVASNLEPEILILDEALNTGDAAFSKRAAAKMKDLVSKAKMVILVTHSLRFARRNCDRLVWLDKGVIRGVGDPSEILEQYKASVPAIARKPKKARKLELNKTETTIKEKTVVKAENVGVVYRYNNTEFWALRNVNFEIKEGEVIGIIGHNGAGKSTLCKLMTNILSPDEGKMRLNGETTSLLGYGTGFNAQLSGEDNVYLNGMLLGIPKNRVEKDYPNIVAFSGLEKSMHKPIKSYSSGMRARLGFSIAATLQPDIFIIDEALSTGDMAFKQKASEKIQEMMESAKAVIIVSHSMRFVEQVCTRAIWMERGRVKLDGDAKEVVDMYRTEVQGKKENKKPVQGKTSRKGKTKKEEAGQS